MTENPFCDDAAVIQAMEQVRNGDSDAFHLIYNHCFRKVHLLCRCRLCWADRCIHFEEDLTSEVMTSVWKSLRDPRTHWTSVDQLWQAIHRLILERCINRGRHNKRQKRRTISDLSLLFETLYRYRESVGGIAQVDTDDLLQALLRTLHNDELSDLVECKLQGLSNREIAAQRHISMRTIQRKLNSVRQVLDLRLEIQVES